MSEEIGEERIDWIREILRDAETTTRLSPWQTEFMDSMRERVLTHAERTRISPRQMEKLLEIEQRMYQ